MALRFLVLVGTPPDPATLAAARAAKPAAKPVSPAVPKGAQAKGGAPAVHALGAPAVHALPPRPVSAADQAQLAKKFAEATAPEKAGVVVNAEGKRFNEAVAAKFVPKTEAGYATLEAWLSVGAAQQIAAGLYDFRAFLTHDANPDYAGAVHQAESNAGAWGGDPDAWIAALNAAYDQASAANEVAAVAPIVTPEPWFGWDWVVDEEVGAFDTWAEADGAANALASVGQAAIVVEVLQVHVAAPILPEKDKDGKLLPAEPGAMKGTRSVHAGSSAAQRIDPTASTAKRGRFIEADSSPEIPAGAASAATHPAPGEEKRPAWVKPLPTLQEPLANPSVTARSIQTARVTPPARRAAQTSKPKAKK